MVPAIATAPSGQPGAAFVLPWNESCAGGLNYLLRGVHRDRPFVRSGTLFVSDRRKPPDARPRILSGGPHKGAALKKRGQASGGFRRSETKSYRCSRTAGLYRG